MAELRLGRRHAAGDYYSVTVRLDDDLYRAIERLVVARGSTKRRVLNELLRDALAALGPCCEQEGD